MRCRKDILRYMALPTNGPGPHSTLALEPAEVVRKARNIRQLSQAAFAAELKVTQSEISRYESGKAEPPRQTVMYCMHILQREGDEQAIESLGLLFARRLASPRYEKLRLAIVDLLREEAAESRETTAPPGKS